MPITNRIHCRNVKGDIFGGLTVAVITLPMALSFGVTSDRGAAGGLWGASKVMAQRQNILDNDKTLVIDLTNLLLLGVSATAALEKTIDDAYAEGLEVFIIGGEGRVLISLKIIPNPVMALLTAIAFLNQENRGNEET